MCSSDLSAAAGGLLAVAWRATCDVPTVPLSLTRFAAVAALIGATEELLFRGVVQGRLRSLSPATAVLAAALLHTAYKLSLFATPAPGELVNLRVLLTCTLAGGVAFGAVRQVSGSVWPCVAAHAAFDILGYGDCTAAPTWVWN